MMVICEPPIRLDSGSHLFVESGGEPKAYSLGDSTSTGGFSCKLGSWRGDVRGGEPSSDFRIPILMPPACMHL